MQKINQPLDEGRAGYLLKTTEGEALTAVIERTLAGESVIAPKVTGNPVQDSC